MGCGMWALFHSKRLGSVKDWHDFNMGLGASAHSFGRASSVGSCLYTTAEAFRGVPSTDPHVCFSHCTLSILHVSACGAQKPSCRLRFCQKLLDLWRGPSLNPDSLYALSPGWLAYKLSGFECACACGVCWSVDKWICGCQGLYDSQPTSRPATFLFCSSSATEENSLRLAQWATALTYIVAACGQYCPRLCRQGCAQLAH
jgi:hypothetical protein